MERYLAHVKKAVGKDVMRKIVGWRYLVQYKHSGTMLTENFKDALKWMGEYEFSFDLGVDMGSGGVWQLTEAVGMIKRVNENVHPTQEYTSLSLSDAPALERLSQA